MSRLFVTVYYGPTESFYTLVHRPQKLKGLRMSLQQLGFLVHFIPIEYRDLCLLEMFGHEVFRCNISHLAFNMSKNIDPVCSRAVDAVMEASRKFSRARLVQWTWVLLEKEIFRRGACAPVDYWQQIDVDYAAIANKADMDCTDCCRIFKEKRTEEEKLRLRKFVRVVRVCMRRCCQTPAVIYVPRSMPKKMLRKYFNIMFYLSTYIFKDSDCNLR